MNFLTLPIYKFEDLVQLDLNDLLKVVNKLSREEIIDWLCWNDKNGIYRDDLSIKELGHVMSREEGMEIMLRQLDENRLI